MKCFLLLGGTLGFMLTFLSGIYAGLDLSIIIRNSAIACLVGALAMKGVFHLLVWCARRAALERARLEAEAEEALTGVKS